MKRMGENRIGKNGARVNADMRYKQQKRERARVENKIHDIDTCIVPIVHLEPEIDLRHTIRSIPLQSY